MKKVITTLFAGLSFCSSIAQSPSSLNEAFHFIKEVPVTALQGKLFRYEIAVKADPADSSSGVHIYGTACGQGDNNFLQSDFVIDTRTEQEWTIYTVAGKVHPAATRLWFYTSVNGKGNFYFDDLSFYIQKEGSQWKQLTLSNASFEESIPGIFNGYYTSNVLAPGLQTQLSREFAKTGQFALQITSGTITASSNAAVK